MTPRLPHYAFASMADHVTWLALGDVPAMADATDSSGDARAGSCMACLRATTLSGGLCDCPDRLDAASRALMHAAFAEGGLCGWSRLLFVGESGAVARRLRAAAAPEPPAEGDADLVVCMPFPGAMATGERLVALRRALVVGGCLVAPLAFDVAARFSHDGALGWDVLDQARAAGFASALVLRPRSRELGYGSDLALLKAVA